jgi:hypothetical protein
LIIKTEADVKRVSLACDRREIRNFMRFCRLWPIHGYDMLQRPRWRCYMNVTEEEARKMTQKPIVFNKAK